MKKQKRKLDYTGLKIIDVNFGRSNGGSLIIQWMAPNIGFGAYIIKKDSDGNLIGNSETMDSNEDKWFLKQLLKLLVRKITIE